jgi:LuxR family quorum-sensing system transcriptional regulator CciR
LDRTRRERAAQPRKEMFDRVDRFVRDVSHIACEADLSDALAEVARELGFAWFALTHHVDPRIASQPAIRLANYPDEWVAYFDAHRLGSSDPVHRASQLTSVGFAWSRLARMIDLTARDREILALATASGIGDGFTVPAHVPGEANGSCSFALPRGIRLQEERLPAAQLIGAFAFEAARRLWRMRAPVPVRPPLTDRQRECLVWAARGKTDWEISRILGVGHETVIRHLKLARERYGVTKRTMLLVSALFDGTVSFADILKR